MRNRDQERQKATGATVTFQDKEGRCLVPFADILAYFARKAKLALPRANGRTERALEIVLDARNVREAPDYTTFYIHSQNGGGWYTVTDAGCECKDYQFNGGPCKHMIARWLVIRGQQASGTRPSEADLVITDVRAAIAELEAEIEQRGRPWACDCVLPSQTCPACEAAARATYSDDWEVL